MWERLMDSMKVINLDFGTEKLSLRVLKKGYLFELLVKRLVKYWEKRLLWAMKLAVTYCLLLVVMWVAYLVN